MIVVLLGAGASKAYGESPTGVRMPIALDFFATFEKLSIAQNPWVLKEGLYDYLRWMRRVDPATYLSRGIDIEQLHSEIEGHLLQADKNRDPMEWMILYRAYHELIFIFSSVINEIQNGPTSNAHEALANRLKEEDVVITFNWDTLMDRALVSRHKWATDYGYGFLPKSIFRNRWTSPTQEEESIPYTRLIKLHGSTNWLTSHPISPEEGVTLMQKATPDTVWIYEQTERPYDCFAGRFMPGYQEFSYGYYPPNILDDVGRSAPEGHLIMSARPRVPSKPEGTAGSKGLPTIPLIIPPVRDKKYDFYGPLFQRLWDEAQDALRRAAQILIIGYSFPRTDIKTNELFKSAFMNRETMPKISILDPSPDRIAEKMRLEFGITSDHLKVCKDYFTEKFNLDELLN